MTQVLEVKAQPIVVRNYPKPCERKSGAKAEGSLVQLAKAILHGRRIEVHEERVRRQVIQVVVLEARDICGNLEASIAQFLVKANVACSTGPLEDALNTLADECFSVIGRKTTLLFMLLNQLLGTIREDRSLRQERLNACTRGWIKVIRHQERCKHPMLWT